VSAAKNHPSIRASHTQNDFSPIGGNLNYYYIVFAGIGKTGEPKGAGADCIVFWVNV
jgi:hypothetical protein